MSCRGADATLQVGVVGAGKNGDSKDGLRTAAILCQLSNSPTQAKTGLRGPPATNESATAPNGMFDDFRKYLFTATLTSGSASSTHSLVQELDELVRKVEK